MPAGCGTRSGCRCRPGCPWRSPSRFPIRSVIWWPGTPAATGRSPRRLRRAGTGLAWRSSPARCTASPRSTGSSRASSFPGAGAPNGATRRCSACCAAAAWPNSARRSNPRHRRRWRRSCLPGRTRASPPKARGAARRGGPPVAGARPARMRSSTRSISSPGRRCQPRRLRHSCSPAGFRAISPPCSTN